VLSALATVLALHAWDRADEAAQRSIEPVQLAEQLDSPATVPRCLEARHTISWVPGAAPERNAIAERMASVARTSGAGELHSTALLLEMTARFELADPRGLTVAERVSEVGSALQHPKIDYLVLTRRAALAVLRGDAAAAAALVDEAARLSERIGEPDSVFVDYHLRAELLRFERGRGALLDRHLPPNTARMSLFGVVERPVMLLDAGRTDDARNALKAAAAVPFDQVARDQIFLHDLVDLAEAATRLGDLELAIRCYDVLLPSRGTACVAPVMACFSGAVDHQLGLLALHLGRAGDAVGHLEEALAMHERLGRCSGHAPHANFSTRPGPRSRRRHPGKVCWCKTKVWRVAWGGVEAHVADTRGIGDLAVLLERGSQEVSAAELYARQAGGSLPLAQVNDRGDAAVWNRIRGRSERSTRRTKSWLIDSGFTCRPVVLQNIQSSGPWGSPSARRRRCHCCSTAAVPASMSMQRRLVRVLAPNSVGFPATLWMVRRTEMRRTARSRSFQRSPATSPRRMPVWAVRCRAG